MVKAIPTDSVSVPTYLIGLDNEVCAGMKQLGISLMSEEHMPFEDLHLNLRYRRTSASRPLTRRCLTLGSSLYFACLSAPLARSSLYFAVCHILTSLRIPFLTLRRPFVRVVRC